MIFRENKNSRNYSNGFIISIGEHKTSPHYGINNEDKTKVTLS